MAFDKRFLYEVAKHYYELEKTQSEIASSLGISRSQVSRALKRAKDAGDSGNQGDSPGVGFRGSRR